MSRLEDPVGCCTPLRELTPTQGVPRSTGDGSVAPTQSPSRAPIPGDMVFLDGGAFLMGTDDDEGFPEDGEGPVRSITVSPYAIDAYAVSNTRFAEFVEQTGYQTEAESFGWSFVFQLFVPKKLIHKGTARKVRGLQWWYGVNGAYWRRPEGPGSSLDDRWDHPVTHVSWSDAVAFATWAGRRLPTEAEWEYAARGGLEQRRFAWGDELTPGGDHRCNIWQGSFPRVNSRDDGYAGTCPVDSYLPNGFGTYNMAGNVWEWCSDWWSSDYHLAGPRENPIGPAQGSSRVMRGGSYLCHHSYCNRYRVAARTANTPDSSTGNLGFRTAADWRKE